MLNVISQSEESTVMCEYFPTEKRSESYQSEAQLEEEFINILKGNGYEYLNIKDSDSLVSNLRLKLSKLNNYEFTDNEWETFFNQVISNSTLKMEHKTKLIQEEYTQLLKCDDGTSKNIILIDKKNVHNNSLQVINQYEVSTEEGAKHNNRYDVTILVNGFPMIHIELKRRGVPIREAFNQIDRYQRESFWAASGLYEFVQIFVISNGTNTKYYSNTTRFNHINGLKKQMVNKVKTSNSFEFTSFWADANNSIIPDLVDFGKTFFARHTILNILTKYCVYTSEGLLLVMRPYQIVATERIINCIEIANNYKKFGSVEGGGYIWHTTGSGKTLTSFKTAQLISRLNYIEKVLFVVDRKDLDYQTMKEYDRFEKGAANSNTSTLILKRQLEDKNARIIITTIQKLATFIKRNNSHEVFDKHVVIIFDECHRSQFGDMHSLITKHFKKYHLFGFTGTPIFTANSSSGNKPTLRTTSQAFGDKLHTYTIVDAINDKNVLPFRVDYIKTMGIDEDIDDKEVWDINREKLYLAPERIRLVTDYILTHFDKKTYRGDKSYTFNVLQNISSVASSNGRDDIEEIKVKQRINGFNSIFAVSSVEAAKLYYSEFIKQMNEDPKKNIKIALIYSYGANEEEIDGNFDEENSEDASSLEIGSREFLEYAIKNYNKMFHTNYSTDGDRFQNYYKDVSLRMKNKEIDLLIVVNMFLTGFDATTLNTLWVDKNLKMHGLLQAYSRTNRILNSVKTFGNIVCFRNLQRNTDEAISLFGNRDSGGVILLRGYKDYYYGFNDDNNKFNPGYANMIDELTKKFPLTDKRIEGYFNQKNFINLFGKVLRMKNLLSSFDDFDGNEILSERDLQDYLGRYQDLRDEFTKIDGKQKEDVTDDVVFEIELIKQIEINIDYIIMLIKKYKDSHCDDKEVLITIEKSVNASPTLRSKKDLIINFINKTNEVDDIMDEWRDYVNEEKESQLIDIIKEENLKEDATRKFIKSCFRDGFVKTIGTDIDKIMPASSLFKGDRSRSKIKIIDKLSKFFERFRGI